MAPAALALAVLGGAAPAASATIAPAGTAVVHEVMAARDCIAMNNHDEVVAKFISRCKQGKIRSEISSDRLSRTLGEVYAGKLKGDRDDVKAWKLLSDHRFDK